MRHPLWALLAMLAFGNTLPGALFGGKPKTKKYPEITQEEYEKEAIHQQELLMRTPRMRARNIAFDVLTKNAEFCSSVVHVIGIAFNPRTTWISEVRPGSPADRAGLKIGDVLLSINGDKARPRNLDRLIRKHFTNTDAEDVSLWIEGGNRSSRSHRFSHARMRSRSIAAMISKPILMALKLSLPRG